jgi:hypothetical protein
MNHPVYPHLIRYVGGAGMTELPGFSKRVVTGFPKCQNNFALGILLSII